LHRTHNPSHTHFLKGTKEEENRTKKKKNRLWGFACEDLGEIETLKKKKVCEIIKISTKDKKAQIVAKRISNLK
jgi:hypothetical protein